MYGPDATLMIRLSALVGWSHTYVSDIEQAGVAHIGTVEVTAL